jgi:hypothetical protein
MNKHFVRIVENFDENERIMMINMILDEEEEMNLEKTKMKLTMYGYMRYGKKKSTRKIFKCVYNGLVDDGQK